MTARPRPPGTHARLRTHWRRRSGSSWSTATAAACACCSTTPQHSHCRVRRAPHARDCGAGPGGRRAPCAPAVCSAWRGASAGPAAHAPSRRAGLAGASAPQAHARLLSPRPANPGGPHPLARAPPGGGRNLHAVVCCALDIAKAMLHLHSTNVVSVRTHPHGAARGQATGRARHTPAATRSAGRRPPMPPPMARRMHPSMSAPASRHPHLTPPPPQPKPPHPHPCHVCAHPYPPIHPPTPPTGAQ